MSYCTQADLEKAKGSTLLVQLTDESGTGSVDTDRLNAAIEGADGIINGNVRKHYAVPLSPVPALIKVLAVDLTVHALYGLRPEIGTPEEVTTRYKAAMEMLIAIREGKLDLGIEPPAPASSAVMATSSGPERLFTEKTLEDF